MCGADADLGVSVMVYDVQSSAPPRSSFKSEKTNFHLFLKKKKLEELIKLTPETQAQWLKE